MSVVPPTRPSGNSVLLIGYGNPGRRDDGLGPALAERLESSNIPNVIIDSDYQLNIEHAHDLADFDIVVFADATIGRPTDEITTPPYTFEQIEAGNPISFSTHSVSPQAVLRLAVDLFEANTKAYVLGITGYEFDDIAEGLTDGAAANLDQATGFISDWLGYH